MNVGNCQSPDLHCGCPKLYACFSGVVGKRTFFSKKKRRKDEEVYELPTCGPTQRTDCECCPADSDLKKLKTKFGDGATV